MKRHFALEPFSRDHNDGLILARLLGANGASALAKFRASWISELADHFFEEERLLGPLCPDPQRERLAIEHAEIEELGKSATSDEDAHRLGRLLRDHIRWEERELFGEIEANASEMTLAKLAKESMELEKRRGLRDSRRAELVGRRSPPLKPQN